MRSESGLVMDEESVMPMVNLRDDFITAKEVAYSFGYTSIKSFYNAVNAGRFPVRPVVFGKRWYFRRKSIELLMRDLGAAE